MLPGVIAKMSHQIWFILIVRPPMNSSWKQKHVICRLWNQKNHLLWDHCWQKILEIDATMLNLLHLLCTCLTNPLQFLLTLGTVDNPNAGYGYTFKAREKCVCSMKKYSFLHVTMIKSKQPVLPVITSTEPNKDHTDPSFFTACSTSS